MKRRITLLILLVGLTTPFTSSATVPLQINFQGKVTTPAGDTVPPGMYQVRFRVYDHATAGTILWESFDGDDQYVPVGVTHGLFNHILGSTNELPLNLHDHDSLWLGIRIGPSEDEMLPRTPFTSVMYSLRSANSDSARISESVVPNSIGSTSIVDASIELEDIAQNGAVVGQGIVWNGSGWIPGTVIQTELDPQVGTIGIDTLAKWNGISLTGSSIYDDGNVGIGTSNPQSKLEVAGQIHSTIGGVKFPDGSVQTSAAAFPSGTLVPFAGAVPPTGWVFADGSALSRTTYAQLFAVIGTTYGSGDGSTTFNLPDLRARTVFGKSDIDPQFDALGEFGGEKSHVLTLDELTPHSHSFSLFCCAVGSDRPLSGGNGGSGGYGTSTTGGGQPFSVLNPYVAMNFLIKL